LKLLVILLFSLCVLSQNVKLRNRLNGLHLKASMGHVSAEIALFNSFRLM
jgi:hypothetical protein